MNPLGTWDTFQDLRREQDRARRQRNAAHHTAAAEQARAEGRHDAAQYHEQRARGWRGEPTGPPVPEPQPSTSPATNAGGATTGAGGGAGVSHASEGNAQLQQAAQNGESAQGAVQQVIDELQQMLQNFLAAAEESQHPEAETVSGQITQAISQAEELQQFIGATKDATEGVHL